MGTGRKWHTQAVHVSCTWTTGVRRMNPSTLCCPHLACPDKGVIGGGNIGIHSRVEARYRCRTCGKTCAATTNTPFYRRHHPSTLMTLVLPLLLHGCPIPAI